MTSSRQVDLLPADLVPLPTAPWDVRPVDVPLDSDECRTALWLEAGNITEAAVILKVSPGRLRSFVKGSEFLTREMAEAKESMKDIAEGNVVDALTDMKDAGRRDTMSRWYLERQARDRGYGNAAGKASGKPLGRITITWEGEEPEDDTPMIEAVANDR